MGWGGDSSIGDTLKRSPHRAGFFFPHPRACVLTFGSASEAAVCRHLHRFNSRGDSWFHHLTSVRIVAGNGPLPVFSHYRRPYGKRRTD
jgi:hypothetical protein